jgi:hypothetical protein
MLIQKCLNERSSKKDYSDQTKKIIDEKTTEESDESEIQPEETNVDWELKTLSRKPKSMKKADKNVEGRKRKNKNESHNDNDTSSTTDWNFQFESTRISQALNLDSSEISIM